MGLVWGWMGDGMEGGLRGLRRGGGLLWGVVFCIFAVFDAVRLV